MAKQVNYEVADAVAVIALNRPDNMNAFTTDLRADLAHALHDVANDNSVRVVVLTGEGRCFSAGADLKESLGGRPVGEQLREEYRPVFAAIAELPVPVIAAIPGSAAGIGMSLALHCDLVIMAEDAFLLSPFSTISLVPDGGLNWMLVRQLGYKRAFQLSVEAERIDAARCVQLGLANRTAPASALQSTALEWARDLSQRAPLALAATKKVMRFAMDNDWDSSYDLEAQLQGSLVGTADNNEGIEAFLQKRKPEFKGKK
jgi:2-(1,2-epoxy-1,2-dihydrophenyl)acetyl-CoA isomerase